MYIYIIIINKLNIFSISDKGGIIPSRAMTCY